MKLEIGKRYVRRDGTITNALGRCYLPEYPFRCENFSYTKDGLQFKGLINSPKDIISEYVAERDGDFQKLFGLAKKALQEPLAAADLQRFIAEYERRNKKEFTVKTKVWAETAEKAIEIARSEGEFTVES